jgi:hypothetical protein
VESPGARKILVKEGEISPTALIGRELPLTV